MTLRDRVIRLINDLGLDADNWSDDMIDCAEIMCADRGVPDDAWLPDERRVAVHCVWMAVNAAGDAPTAVRAKCEWIDPIWGQRSSCNPRTRWAQIVDTDPAVGARLDLNDRMDWIITWCFKTLTTRIPSGEIVEVWRAEISSGDMEYDHCVAVLHDEDDGD